jgi:hypothetical protein
LPKDDINTVSISILLTIEYGSWKRVPEQDVVPTPWLILIDVSFSSDVSRAPAIGFEMLDVVEATVVVWWVLSYCLGFLM